MFRVVLVLAASLSSKARSDTKKICVPPGDHKGRALPAPAAVSLVSGVAPEPSAFTAQTFGVLLVLRVSLPSRARAETKTIFLPSGDDLGVATPSAAEPESFVTGVAPEPSTSINQAFEVPNVLTESLPSSARPE